MVKRKRLFSITFLILFIILIVYSAVVFVLFGWSLLTSIRENLSFIENPFSLSGGIHLENYVTVFLKFKTTVQKIGGGYTDVYLEEMFMYSLVYAIGCSLVNTFVTCVVAYIAAKFEFKICKLLYLIVILVMSLPIVGNLPAEISMAKLLGIYGTMGGMFIMRATFLGPYFLIFAAINKGIPQDYTEAGYIDGANEFVIFFKLMLPLVKDTFITIFLLNFVVYWNDYSIPLIYLPDKPPLALGLYRFNASTDNEISSVPMKMAGCLIVTIPILLFFIAFQNKLMGNLSMGGLKE